MHRASVKPVTHSNRRRSVLHQTDARACVSCVYLLAVCTLCLCRGAHVQDATSRLGEDKEVERGDDHGRALAAVRSRRDANRLACCGRPSRRSISFRLDAGAARSRSRVRVGWRPAAGAYVAWPPRPCGGAVRGTGDPRPGPNGEQSRGSEKRAGVHGSRRPRPRCQKGST